MTVSNTALIDGDLIVYKIAFEKQPQQETAQQGFSSADASSSAEAHDERSWASVKESIDKFMLHLRLRTQTEDYIGFLSPKRSEGFRNEFAKTLKYKGNRDNRELPFWFDKIKEYLIQEYGFQQLTKMEADDALACLQTSWAKLNGHETIICSIDKDLLQVSGKHFNWKDDEFKEVDHRTGYQSLWKQVLTGDTTDNIIGCGEMAKTYWGAKKTLVDSGDFVIVDKDKTCGPKEFHTKKARDDHFEALFVEALERESVANYLKDTYGIEPVVRREGIGPKEADKIIDEAGNLAMLPSRVLVEYVNRFGLSKGINKYHEAFNLIFMLREWPEWEVPFHGTRPWVAKTEEDAEEDEF